MQRRNFLTSVMIGGLAVSTVAAEDKSVSVRGRLKQGNKLVTTDGSALTLTGDEPTRGVIADQRLLDADFEAMGQKTAPDAFTVDPIHTRAMFVHKDGQKLLVTYWCDICYIRTYTPGKCWCCQEDTRLDLIDPAKADRS